MSGLMLVCACDRTASPGSSKPGSSSPPVSPSAAANAEPATTTEPPGVSVSAGTGAADSTSPFDENSSGKAAAGASGNEKVNEKANDKPTRPLPPNYRQGVERVRELRDTIRAALAAERYDDADPPLHELAALLRAMPRLADRESFVDEERRQITRALDDLFHMFAQVDARLHGGFGVSYDRLADDIDVAIERLAPRAGPAR